MSRTTRTSLPEAKGSAKPEMLTSGGSHFGSSQSPDLAVFVKQKCLYLAWITEKSDMAPIVS